MKRTGGRATLVGRRRLLAAVRIVPLAVVVALTGCANKNDAASTQVDFARSGEMPTLVLAPQTPGHPALKGFLEEAYARRGVTSPIREEATPADLTRALETMAKQRPAALVVELGERDQQPADALAALVKAGTSVLCIGQRPVNTGDMCTAFVGWDDWAGGFEQAAALQQALGPNQGRRWNVESIGLAPGDKGAEARLRGSVIQRLPHAANSPTITKTGRLSYTQVEVPGASPSEVTKQLSTTIQATYLTQPMDGLLLPTDAYLEPTKRAFAENHQPLPKLVSAGTTEEGMHALATGLIVATQYQDPKVLAHEVALNVASLRSGTPLVTSPRRNWENKIGSLPTVFITPVTVTRANASTTLADAPTLRALLK